MTIFTINLDLVTQPLHHVEDLTKSQFVKWSRAGLNLEFSFF